MAEGQKNGGRFKPGQSGNPGGKPKAIIEVTQAARERTTNAIETLEEVMLNPKATQAARVSAAIAILDRGWGKAPQTMTVRREGDYASLSDDELIAIASGAIQGEPSGDGTSEDPEKLN